MNGEVLLYVAAGFLAAWGIGHLFPTMNIVKGFGELSEDNRRIILMEWIGEGVTLIFMGVLVFGVTLAGVGPAARAVYWITSGALVVMTGVSLFTGARISFLAFRLCPPIFLTAVALIQIGMRL